MRPVTLPALPSLLALFAALSFGCSSSTAKPADGPSSATDAPSDDPPAKDAKPDDDPKQVVPLAGPRSAGPRDDTIPDDYSLTESDCDALGKQYGEVATADQMAPLNEKQRKASEAGIEKVVSKLTAQWIEGCQGSLAGKIVDRKVLKCAMGSRTVAEFKTCLGDDSAVSKPGGKRVKKGG